MPFIASTIDNRLEEIVRAIGEPTWVDILSVLVSALAAIGTLAVAAMNFRLLRRQAESDRRERETRARARRGKYAQILRRITIATAFAKLEQLQAVEFGLEHEPSEAEIGKLAMQADLLGAESGEPSALAIRTHVVSLAHDGVESTDVDPLMALLDDCERLLDEWTEMPFFPSAGSR